MTALRREMDIIANNIANQNTPGYQSEKPLFLEYLAKQEGLEKVSYVHDYGTAKNLSQGSLSRTGNSLDVAIEGDGYFALQTPQGTRYTRNGHFTLNEIGQIVNSNGNAVMAGGSTITVTAEDNNIAISTDGTVSSDRGVIGKLDIVTFENPQELMREGSTTYSAENLEATPATNAKVRQGFVEGSNVNPMIEITNMIDVVRRYQSAAKLEESEHQRHRNAIRRLTTVQ